MRIENLQKMFDFDSNGNIAVNNSKHVVTDASDVSYTGSGSLAATNVAAALDELEGLTGGGGNAFGTVAVSGQSDVVADSANDTLTLVAGTGITITTNAGTDSVTITNSSSGGVSDGDKGDITVSGSGATWTVDNDAITFAKMQNITADRLIGRNTAGSGDAGEIRVEGGIEFTGTGGLQTSAFTGDVTKSAGGTTQTIANDAVTYAKMQNVSAASRLIRRGDSGSGDPQEITLGTNLSMSGTTLNATGGSSDGFTVIVKSANQDVTNAGLTNDDDFSFAVVTGGHYLVDMDLVISGNDTTGDYTMDFTVSAGNQRGKGTCQGLTAAAAVSNVIVTAAGVASTTAIPIGAPTASLDDLVAVKVTYAFTASADATFRFRFGNAAAAAGRTSRTWKGSVFRYKRLD